MWRRPLATASRSVFLSTSRGTEVLRASRRVPSSSEAKLQRASFATRNSSPARRSTLRAPRVVETTRPSAPPCSEMAALPRSTARTCPCPGGSGRDGTLGSAGHRSFRAKPLSRARTRGGAPASEAVARRSDGSGDAVKDPVAEDPLAPKRPSEFLLGLPTQSGARRSENSTCSPAST